LWTGSERSVALNDAVGKTVLLGLTFQTADGELIEQIQRHGVIEAVDSERGIGVRLVAPGFPWDRELYWLPPDPSHLRPAAPGAYTLRSTGETIVDPDFLTSWEIRSPAPGESTPEQIDARRDEARRLGFPPD
jgi:hypothetical protein